VKSTHRAVSSYQTAATATPQDDAAILRRYGTIVERLARRFVLRTGMPSVYDDLWAAGALGLIEAARRFDGSKGASFETFVEHRIRGAMLDELRRLDHLPRRLRSRTDEVSKARRKLNATLGREATTEEVAAELKIDVEEASGMEALLEAPMPLERALPFLTTEDNLEDPILRAEAVRRLADAIETLPERLRVLLSLHYIEDLTYREIARLLEVSEPRVCQLHAEAVAKLRAELEE
jgi:RNA polymerase sigma factor for flagellar operon FliA